MRALCGRYRISEIDLPVFKNRESISHLLKTMIKKKDCTLVQHHRLMGKQGWTQGMINQKTSLYSLSDSITCC